MWKLPVIHLVLTELSKNTRVTNLFKLKKRIRKGKNIGGIGIQNQRPSMGSNNCKNQEKSFDWINKISGKVTSFFTQILITW